MVEARELHDVDPFATHVDPFTAVESLRAALEHAGIVLPSLAVEATSPALGLIDLGRVRAEVAMRLADALRRGGSTV